MDNLKLNADVNRILSLIENLTGKSFEFVQKETLPVLAVVKAARRSMPRHIIIYKRSDDSTINHIIAHECGHIKRIFEAPEEKRVLYASNEQTQAAAFKAMSADQSAILDKFGKESTKDILIHLLEGIIRQVTNQPIDLMIEKWLYNDYPGLRQLQLDSLIHQNKLALSGLNESVKLFPKIIVNASNTLNAAFMDQLTKIVKYKLNREWKKTPYFSAAKELGAIIDVAKPWTPQEDPSKVIACAEFFNISSWFFTAPFENIPLDYTNF